MTKTDYTFKVIFEIFLPSKMFNQRVCLTQFAVEQNIINDLSITNYSAICKGLFENIFCQTFFFLFETYKGNEKKNVGEYLSLKRDQR